MNKDFFSYSNIHGMICSHIRLHKSYIVLHIHPISSIITPAVDFYSFIIGMMNIKYSLGYCIWGGNRVQCFTAQCS